jgi:hypothetical protein
MKFRFLPPSIRLAIAFTAMAAIPIAAVPAAAQAPGGFVEKATSTNVRPTYTAAQIQQFVPPTRGPFNFPPPYNTDGVRLTLPSDCGGQDCVFHVGYSYWRNINNHQGSNTMLIVLGLDVNHGGTGPNLFSYNKVTDQVTNLGPLFPPTSNFRNHSADGWYFSATQPNTLYVIGYGPQLYRYDVISKTMTTVFDVSTQPGLFGTNRYAIQAHSSNDDMVHSATLRDKATDKDLGCFVYKEASKQFLYYPTLGLLYDECQIDKSGRYLLIKERISSASSPNIDNRIIDVTTNTETRLLEANGAVGHSDAGFGYSAGALMDTPIPGVVTVWKYGQNPLQGTQVFRSTSWNGGIGHIAHSNAKAGLPQNQQYACGSNASRVNDPRLNEVICFRLDTSMDVLVVAPVMTNLNAAGGDFGGCGDYCKLPKGNIDVTGQYFIWATNMGGNRQDAFIVKVPSHLLVASTSPPPPTADTTPPVISAISAPLITSSGATITWTTNEASDSQIEYGATTAYGGTTAPNGGMVTSHSQNLSGLAANTLYHYRVKSRDAAGNLATSPDKTFTTLAGTTPPPPPSGDVTPPTVSITAPLAGRTVQGPIKVTASASDNVGVVGVQFRIDGQNLGTEDTVRPFARTWYTGGFTNGTHTITAVARDKAGNTATSQPVIVTVKGGKITGPVTWTNLVGATATGNTLRESCGGCGNSGARSLQSIASGNGYFEFTASETTTQRAVGLSRGNTDNSRADIDFAIALWNGSFVEIYENGVYKFGSVPFVSGDVFRVAVVSGVVKYSKNGSVFYTSAKAPTYPLLVDASLAGVQSTIANAMISGY